jgi:carboxyl-terminal processing protease
MPIIDLVLFILVFAVFIFAIIAKIKKISFRADILIYLIPLVFSVIHLVVCGLNYFMVPVMISSIFILLLYPAKKRWFAFIPVAIISLALALASIILPQQDNMQNYASLSYVESFQRLNSYFEDVYPLADHKNIDFESKYAEFLPLFEESQRNNDKKAFYEAINSYIASFSDAHIVTAPADAFLSLTFSIPEFMSWREADIGGDLGFSTVYTDDGRALAVSVDKSSDAYAKGLRDGDGILTYDGQNTADVASEIPMNFAPQGSADVGNRLILQHMMLGRCPVGKSVTVTFSKTDGSVNEMTITAVEKDYYGLQEIFDIMLRPEAETPEELYTYKLLDDKTAYMRIGTMYYENAESAYNQVKKDLTAFAQGDGKDLIIDLRQNGGGDDDFGAKLKGLFTDQEDFYLTESLLNQQTGKLEPVNTITVQPTPVGFNGRIIILVNAGSASAAEGFAYNMAELPNVSVAGMMGSNGSFGTISDGPVLMPDNLVLIFPKITCVDENGRVMIDTDVSGYGGVKPDIKIPLDEQAIDSLFLKHEDYELNYVLEYLAETK